MKARILYPDVLRLLSIIGVILIHVTASTVGELHRITHPQYWWTANIINSAFRWSVPIFVMISGMFVLSSNRTENVKDHYKKIVIRLFIPLLIWSFFYYIWGIRFQINEFNMASFFKQFIQDDVHYHLWYMYMLIVLYMLAPLLRAFIKGASDKMILYFCVLFLMAPSLLLMFNHFYLKMDLHIPKLTMYAGYFVWGYYLARVAVAIKYRVIMYIVGIMAFLVTTFGNYQMLFYFPDSEDKFIFFNYNSLPVVLTATAVFVLFKQINFETISLVNKNFIRMLSASTFSIYISHLFFFEYFYEWYPWDIINGNPLVYVPTVAVLVGSSSFVLFMLLNRILNINWLINGAAKLSSRGHGLLQQWKEIFNYREMLWNLILKELRAKYKGSILGFFWTFLNPLLMLAIYSLVFTFIMKTEIPNFPMFIFVALLPWNYLVNSLVQGAGCFIQNAELLKKIYFPREVLPISVVLSNLINYVLTLIVLIPALLFFKIDLEVTLFSFPIVLLVETLLIMFLVMIVSIATVYFRDLEHILGVFVMVWFYLTPILFPLSLIPEAYRWLFEFNPVFPLIEAYRDLFLYGSWPDFYLLMKFAIVLILLNLAVFKVFSILQRNIAEEI